MAGSIDEITEELFQSQNSRRSSDPDYAFEDPRHRMNGNRRYHHSRCTLQEVVDTIVPPAPATHALLYTPREVRVLACSSLGFSRETCDPAALARLAAVLLSREGKWDVKNLQKWQNVTSVGEPIEGIFRAMKTLRDVDETHTPKVFADTWSGVIKDIVDISHDNPVYNPQDLEAGGIHYHKFPTVSKGASRRSRD